MRLIGHNPATDVPKPKAVKREMKCLDATQAKAFLEAAKADRLYALYALWLASAAREGELFALAWTDVDFDGRSVSISKSLEEIDGKHRVKDVKTAKGRRRIALPTFAVDALSEHRRAMLAEGHYRADGPVFCSPDGGFLRRSNVLRRSFQPILKRAGLPIIRPYDLRHTAATLLLLANESPKVVSERLGHSTTTLTMDTYSHVLPGMQERAADKLQAVIGS